MITHDFLRAARIALIATLAVAAVPALAAGSHGGGHGNTGGDAGTMGGGRTGMGSGHMGSGQMDGSHMDGGHGHAGMAIGEPGDPAKVSRTIEITMRDNYYEPEAVSVARGETVRFVVVNKGDFVHEFNIGTAAMHEAHQEEMAMMVEHGAIQGGRIDDERMKMDMGGGRTMEHDDPNSALVEAGGRAEIVWHFGGAADLEFACNLPGHYASGMVGDIRFR